MFSGKVTIIKQFLQRLQRRTPRLSARILSAVLVLDFSGSMEQKLDGTVKSQLLQEGMTSFFQAFDAKQPTLVIAFGTNPKRHCDDQLVIRGKSSEVLAKMRKLAPGPFGKTPLARSILELKKFKDEAKYWTSPALILTDGADSCNDDPCAALQELDTLIDLKGKIQLKIIGFDLKADRQQFQCFKNLEGRLYNFALSVAETTDKSSFLRTIDATIQGSVPKSKATVLVLGAPPEAHFQGQSGSTIRSWQGSSRVVLDSGSYQLRLDSSAGTKPITVLLRGGEVLQIRFSDFFQVKTTAVDLACNGLSLEAVPTEITKLIHEKVEPVTLCQSASPPSLLFGDWTLKIKGPWWLKDSAQTAIHLSAGAKVTLTGKVLFEQNIDWIKIQDSPKARVIKFKDSKIVLLPGTLEIPKLKTVEESWLVN